MARAESLAGWQRDRSRIEFSAEFPSLLVYGALILAAPVDLYLAYRAFTSDMHSANFIAVLIIGAMIGLIMLAVSQWGQGMVGSFVTDASDREIHEEVAHLFAPQGWTLNGSTTTEIWYSREFGPRVGVAILLLFFGVLPAIVYVIVARNEQAAHVSWSHGSDGLTHIDVGVTPRNPHGRAIVTWLEKQLNS